MRLLIISLATLATAGGLFSCAGQNIAQKDVPSVVLNNLMATYPAATTIEWVKSNENYEAEFIVNAVEHTALINASGAILQTKYDIAETELPESIKTTVAQGYADLKIDDVEILEKNGEKYYQVELEATGKEKLLVFSPDGKEQPAVSYWD